MALSRNHAAGIQRKDAKWQRRQAGKANSQYENVGVGDNQMVTTKLETKSFETIAPLHLGVLALKVFCIVPAKLALAPEPVAVPASPALPFAASAARR